MEADAGAGLKDVDHKGVVPLALLNFLGSFDDGVGGLRVHEPELAVGLGGGLLHHGDGANQRGVSAQSADGKVLDRTGGLDAVVNVSGNFFVAERIFFGASGWLGHGRCLQQRDDSGGGKGERLSR